MNDAYEYIYLLRPTNILNRHLTTKKIESAKRIRKHQQNRSIQND
jgi:hypothetical protein